MKLPVEPPVEPMLAKLTETIPDGEGWLYEPKWDGFEPWFSETGTRSTCKVATAGRWTAIFPSWPPRCGPPCPPVRCSTARS